MAARRTLEVEVKLPVRSPAHLRRQLVRTGARRLGRVHEQDTLYDSREKALARRGELLRLRLRGGKSFLTYKGREAPNRRYKVRQEIELAVSEPERFQAILVALGFRPWFRYEKYRTSYRLPSLPGLAVELDETPIGAYVELEGPQEAIDRGARLLGYSPRDYLATTYYALYLRARRGRPWLPPGQMLFPRRKKNIFPSLSP